MQYLITTPRLGLRRWLPEDNEPCAEMNADPAVREFFGNLMTRRLFSPLRGDRLAAKTRCLGARLCYGSGAGLS